MHVSSIFIANLCIPCYQPTDSDKVIAVVIWDYALLCMMHLLYLVPVGLLALLILDLKFQMSVFIMLLYVLVLHFCQR